MRNKNKNLYDHVEELSEGFVIGDYRIIQRTKCSVVGEHIKTGELIRYDYIGDKLVYRNR